MRRYGFLYLIVLTCLSCGTDPAAPVLEGTGELTGKWNGSVWRGYGYAVLSGDTLYVRGHRPSTRYYQDDYVSARVQEDGPGVYELAVGDAELAQVTGGDAGWFPRAMGYLTVHALGNSLQGSIILVADGPDDRIWTFHAEQFDLPVYASFDLVPEYSR